MRSSIAVLACCLVLAVAFSDTQKLRAAEDHGTRAGYFVSNSPNMGSFYLEGDSGSCLYTFPVGGPENPTYVMYKAQLGYVGPDGSGSYWHYRIPMPGGLNWYFPKDAHQTPAVWYKIEAPGTKSVYYGPPTLFPIK